MDYLEKLIAHSLDFCNFANYYSWIHSLIIKTDIDNKT